MQKQSILIGLYACLLVVGGIFGFVKAGSMTSLLASSISATLLLLCCPFIFKGNSTAFHLALGLIFCLMGFFSYRFLEVIS